MTWRQAGDGGDPAEAGRTIVLGQNGVKNRVGELNC